MANPEPDKHDNRDLIDLFFESLHLITLHYGLWFSETERKRGLDRAIDIESRVWPRVLPAVLDRLAARLGTPTAEGVPAVLAGASRERLEELLVDMAKSWLAADGIWFQAVEQAADGGMSAAKEINDACWFRFSPIEARLIMRRLGIAENGGISALKTALGHRQYALVNRQEIVDVSENRFIFRMKECRVQLARKRSGLPDYPCKSAGVVEYRRFAETIDPRLRTVCLGCPPDPHPAEWYCAWEFSLEKSLG